MNVSANMKAHRACYVRSNWLSESFFLPLVQAAYSLTDTTVILILPVPHTEMTEEREIPGQNYN